jgi:hypothetical protein
MTTKENHRFVQPYLFFNGNCEQAIEVCRAALGAEVEFMLRGQNWARWLSIVWMAWHVVLSAFHPLSELIMHGVLLAVFALFLFRPRAPAYFQNGRSGRTQHQEIHDRSNL